jgi:hypothetical protein
VTDRDRDEAALKVARYVAGKTYAFPSVQWWEAEEAALKVLEYHGEPLPPKRTGLQ